MRNLKPRSLPPPRRHRTRRRPCVFPGTLFRLRPWLEAMENRTMLSTLLVINTADSGTGSLRQAILDSNAASGKTNTIDFAIPGGGVRMIAPLSALPPIARSVLIDGFSQPGYAGTPVIELSGSRAGLADGLTITGPGVTVRGLDIGGFSQGTGVLITGTGATGTVITANDVGTDPTGTRALSNQFGVRILAGASGNLVGGTDAAAGNLIAFNSGPGVDVEGDSSLGNRITANRIFADGDSGALRFDAFSDVYVSLPQGLLNSSGQSETLEARFQTTGGGVILGYQSVSPYSGGYPSDGSVSLLYVGTDGKLYSGSSDSASGSAFQVNSNAPVNDGQWHNVALVLDGSARTVTLYLDGQLVGSASGSFPSISGSFDQVGIGFANGRPATYGGWYGFEGQISDVRVWSGVRTAGEISQDRTTAPSGTEPGLKADYPFNDGQGLTAYDQTPSHNDGTLAGPWGFSLPTWVAPTGEAIDLGGDGITYNSSSPRQGPNSFQNFPIVVTTADGKLQGRLSGSAPDTTFQIDVFASSAFGPGGAGQAQDYLGSLEVTTDSQGQVLFVVPFTPPAGLPVVTASATDPDGNTSEVSAARQATLQAPAQYLRLVPGQPLIFSAASGDGITLQDPDAGPLAPQWHLTASVAEGTLTLSSLSGLVGSGNGTGTLHYQGTLPALNAALEGLSYTQRRGPTRTSR